MRAPDPTCPRRRLLLLAWTAAAVLGLSTAAPAQPAAETVIRHGLIVTEEGRMEADVRIRGEKIAEIGPGLAVAPGGREIDARGMLLLPGAVDPHTHLVPFISEPPPPGEKQDGYATGSAAAFAGGATTVSNFIPMEEGEDVDAYAARVIGAIEGQGMADVFVHVEVEFDPRPFGRDRLQALAARGFVSTGEDFMAKATFDTQVLEWYRKFRASGEAGVLSMVHAEDYAILAEAKERFMAAGRGSIHNFGHSSPAVSEVVAVQRAVAFAQTTGAPIYILHVSSGLALREAEEAMARGLPVYVETRPMYLHLTQEIYLRPDALLYLGTPPLRDVWDQDRLWEGIAKGTVHTIGTDHSGYTRAAKLDPTQTLVDRRPGLANLQEYLPMMFSEGVLAGRITLEQFVSVTSTNAARLFGFYPRKGTIRVGSDADIVIWDPTETRVIRDEDQLSAAGYSAYAGRQVTGFPRTTLRRGEVVFDQGRVIARPGSGRFIPGVPFRRPALRPLTGRP